MNNKLTGEAVQQMEADLHVANLELDSLRRSNALMDMELTHLRSRNIALQAERDDALIKCAEMRMIMETVSSGLVTGLSRMKFTARQRQERELGVGSETDRAPFQKSITVERTATYRETEERRDLDKAAEDLAPTTPRAPSLPQPPSAPNFLTRPRPAAVRTDIVDPRLPSIEMQSDADRLRQLGDDIEKGMKAR